jgi:gliding motility-associated-like protein
VKKIWTSHYFEKQHYFYRLLLLCTHLLAAPFFYSANAQSCPDNIDFETGTFNGWTCYTGSVSAVGSDNVISLFNSNGPVSNRHTMASAIPGDGFDPYGGFPVNCPNGSRHSIRLGNNSGGGEAEGISYEFTIPAGRNIYNLIYHYAVVFQDPDHQPNEQPRMQIEITNVSDGNIIDCSSFSFHPYGSILPGFFESANPGTDTPVWCKDWSAVSINLNNLAGKTIRLFFKTADCTFRRHFGYAYIDVNSECSGEFVGATYCPADLSIDVVAPYGYQTYTWYDNAFTTVLGSSQSLHLAPPPTAGTTIAVIVVPYDGYGCLDTLYAHLIDTLTVISNAGPDVLSCNKEPVAIGALPKPGLVYRWDPPDGLSNISISNPLAGPAVTTSYVLTTSSSGGGCIDTDTVVVTASVIDTSLQVQGRLMYCVTSGDSVVLRVQPTNSIQWFKDDRPISGATQTVYKPTQSGVYHALMINEDGCTNTTSRQTVVIETPRPGIIYPVEYAIVNFPLQLEARQFGTTVAWRPPTSLSNPSSVTPIFKGSTDQLYLIEITTIAGCLTVDTQQVRTIDRVEMLVPTAFTPNGDGRNDYLRPILKGVKELRYFRIYNRWGQLLFSSNVENLGWNGNFKATSQPTQVVVWMIEGVGLDGVIHRGKGTCVLVR